MASSIRNLHLVNPPQVVEHVYVDCALPGATGHRSPAPDTIGHQANQVVPLAELISEMADHWLLVLSSVREVA